MPLEPVSSCGNCGAASSCSPGSGDLETLADFLGLLPLELQDLMNRASDDNGNLQKEELAEAAQNMGLRLDQGQIDALMNTYMANGANTNFS